jgi:hypothetical protein
MELGSVTLRELVSFVSQLNAQHSSINSPSSGIGLFYADSGFFDGKNLDFWQH